MALLQCWNNGVEYRAPFTVLESLHCANSVYSSTPAAEGMHIGIVPVQIWR